MEFSPKAKRNVPADYAHSVLLLLKNDSQSPLSFCHFSVFHRHFSKGAAFDSGISENSAKQQLKEKYEKKAENHDRDQN